MLKKTKGRQYRQGKSRMAKYITLTLRKFTIFTVSALIAVGTAVTFVHQVLAKESTLADAYAELKVFTDVLALVQKNYVEDVNLKTLIEGAIKGMLLTLDPHSGYMSPETYRELQVETKGEFGGLGIEITIREGLLTVVAPIEDSPAARAGIRPGDQIIKIGDEFTKDLSLVEAVQKMRGPKGSPITISVHREGKTELVPVTVVRDIIKVKSIYKRMLEESFGYVKLTQFQDRSGKEFSSALRELNERAKEKKLHGLVLDLRNNPGGLLTEAIRVADLFLREGIIVYTDGRLESQKTQYFAHDDGNEPSFPIVVIINGGSASASEIVAGALQDHGRALILGSPSFGKGSVQTILPMDEGAALRLTTALYYTKSGRSIQAQGITPDVNVSAKRFPSDNEEVLEEDEEEVMTKEKDLPRAFKNPGDTGIKFESVPEKELTEEESTSKKREKPKAERLPMTVQAMMELDLPKLLREDPQLSEALVLLKTWHVFKRTPTVEAKQPAPAEVPS